MLGAGGMIAEVHRRAALAAGAEVIGALGSSAGRSEEIARRWGATRAYASLDEALSDDSVDTVHICTPNAFHASYAQAALQAGKHVICEKPLAVSLEEAHRMSVAAAQSGLVATVPFIYRYHPLVRELRERRIRGEFGDWILLHGSYLQDWMLSPQVSGWRVHPSLGGPSRAFADIGSHWCDLVEWVSGERFTEVVATTTVAVPERPATSSSSSGGNTEEKRCLPVRTEDAALVFMRTGGGALGSATISQVAAGRKNRLWFELDGTQASAVFDQENPETAWVGTADGARILLRDPSQGSPEQRRLSVLPAGHPQGYAHCFEAFVSDTYAAIDGGTPEGLPTFMDGLRSVQLIDAVLRSSAHDSSWTKV
ncbi:Gfo/Idh/MocA family oxidoreductase [Streptomyces sp. NPDC019396]|uniref:Gfo/Idh/MocA family protein n=1 Tax=Streptomyces sp. NPDC019396 TaxID=3154687 RepID=UPI0034088202